MIQLEPALQLQKVGFATSKSSSNRNIAFSGVLTRLIGAKCGSSYIDANFKRWLRWLIGPKQYRILDPKCTRKVTAHTSEGKLMRKIMGEFEIKKRNFRGKGAHQSSMHIPLPNELAHLQKTGKIQDKELSIT